MNRFERTKKPSGLNVWRLLGLKSHRRANSHASIEFEAAGPEKILEAQRQGLENEQEVVIGYICHGDRRTELTLDAAEKLQTALGEMQRDYHGTVGRLNAAGVQEVIKGTG